MISKKQIIRYLRTSVGGQFQHPRSKAKEKKRKTPTRDWRYRAWIRTLPSAVSGRRPCEAAHTSIDSLEISERGGMSMKSSDRTCIPLTMEEHMEYHQLGQADFERLYGIDCAAIVARLNSTWNRFSKEVK